MFLALILKGLTLGGRAAVIVPDGVLFGSSKAHQQVRTDQSFMVPVAEIRENKYDLSINRYKEVVYEQKTYAAPSTIISEIEALDAERAGLLEQLKILLQ